jgi:RNA-directed DNA polymerase
MTIKSLRPAVSRKNSQNYPLDQSALYKVGSRVRLSKILGLSLNELNIHLENSKKYKIFELKEEICPFTNKVKSARWVQEPRKLLKVIHERIQKLLKRITPPDYTHGAVKGRSYRSNASVHKDSDRVATYDLRKFYPSTSASRVFNFWADQMMCAPDVAAVLTKITCFNNGIPTGSPLSPLLSFYANKPLFDELNQLAISSKLIFTCYIDDLTFSGSVLPKGLSELVGRIVCRFGHILSEKKTRLFRRNQRKHVTGVVIYRSRIFVPHSRFKKARGINKALKLEKTPIQKKLLMQKLAGLLGEAAYLDPSYRGWAQRCYVDLKLITEKADAEAKTLPF